MTKVLFISYYFPPAGGPGVQRSLKFVRYLPQYDIHPLVVTVDPKSASFPVIQQEFLKEVPESVEVYRTKSFEPLKWYQKISAQGEMPHSGFVNEANPGLIKKLSRFIRANLFIPDARVGWNSYAFKQACKLIEEHDIKTVFISSPPHSSQLIGLELKKKYGIKLVADLRDPWTDIYYYKEFKHLPYARKMDKNYELQVLEDADAIVTVSESLKRLFSEKSDRIDAEKIHVIPNGYDEEDIKGLKRQRDRSKYRISYIGTLAESYHVDGLLKAIQNFKEDRTNIELRIVGRIDQVIKALIKEYDLEDIVSFQDFLPHREALQEMFDADVLVLAIPDVPDNAGILTGKLFEYLASGNPILGVGPVNGDAAVILKECQIGTMFHYEAQQEMTTSLIELIKGWESGATLVPNTQEIKRFSRYRLTEELASIIVEK